MQYTKKDYLSLLNKIKIYDSSVCWLWPYSKDTSGYGNLWAPSKKSPHRIHRIMYEMIYGEFDLALDVCHTCDHPACYNPRHLFLGTHKDNMLDRNRKGRNILPPIRFGDKSNLAKLTAQQVEEIRATPYFVIPRAELAKKYGVSKNHITRLKHGYGRKES